MFRADYHVHSSFSGDSNESLDQIFAKANDLGLNEIAITDHIDPDYPSDEVFFEIDLSSYFQTLDRFRKLWAGKLDIRKGLELGLQQHLTDSLIPVLSDPALDFVIGSIHCADRGDFLDETYFEGKSRNEAHRFYFQTMYENLKIFQGVSVIGHMDFIRRYGKEHYGQNHKIMDYQLHMDIIDEILKLAVHNGTGLELNTSGWRYGLDHAHPDNLILSRYRELGGEIITLGSDAHRADHLGEGFRRARDILEATGFRYICGFRKREPLFYPLAGLKVSLPEE